MAPRVISLVVLVVSLAPGSLAAEGARGRLGQEPRREEPRDFVPVDPTYFELSAATGGDFFFWAPGEFGTVALLPSTDGEPVLLSYGDSEDGGVREHVIPIDSTVRRLRVFAGTQGVGEHVLRGPDGEPVRDGQSGVELQRTRHMLLATLDAPARGEWRLTVAGRGLHSVSAHVSGWRDGTGPEVIQILDFDFVELRGRPGHEGYFPLREPPPAGSVQLCLAEISDGHGTAVFEFVDGAGDVVGTLPLVRGRADTARGGHLGSCLVPTVPVRLQVRGEDREGHPWRRLASPMILTSGTAASGGRPALKP